MGDILFIGGLIALGINADTHGSTNAFTVALACTLLGILLMYRKSVRG